jgi:antitoxin (DNA-binding transcriptional repressor) of toxin-antitoxin stability system
MKKATVSQLKNRLSAYLKLVRAGESILILDRDQPIARIDRVERGSAPDDRVTRLERAGLLRRASRPLNLGALRRPVPQPSASVVDALLEERWEGR